MPHPAQRVENRHQGVLHTIEGSLESGLAVFRRHYSPTFTVGAGRIIQHIPLGWMAAALEHTSFPPTNGWAWAQIEVAGHSGVNPWRPDAKTHESLARLLAALSFPTCGGIPLSRPWSDAMPPPPWATSSFARRSSGHWGKTWGWYGHVEIPENSHWDPGHLLWTQLLERAAVIRRATLRPAKPHKVPKPHAIVPAVKHRLAAGGGGRAPMAL